MLSTIDFVRNNAIFYVTWMVAAGEEKKVERNKVLSMNLSQLCESITQLIPKSSKLRDGSKQIGLYVLAQLVHGTVILHREQVDFLQKDVERLKEKVRSNNLIWKLVKQYESEEKKRNKEMSSRQRSRADLIDEDLVDLDNLVQISQGLDINANLDDITMHDFIPSLTSWVKYDYSSDGFELYGPMSAGDTAYIGRNDTTMHSTFVEGHSSDDSEKRGRRELIQDIDDIPRKEKNKKRKYLDPELRIMDNQQVDQTQNPMQNDIDEMPPLRFDDLMIPPLDNTFPPLVPNPFDYSNTILEPEVVQPTPLPEQQPEPIIPEIAPVVPEVEQIIPDVEPIQQIPPLEPDMVVDVVQEPPTKKSKENEQTEEEEIENIRQAAGSRLTNPTFDSSTILHTPGPATRVFDESLEMNSQIIDEIVQRPPRKRRQPVYRDEDMQIETDATKEMMNNYESLLRTREELMVKEDRYKVVPLKDLLSELPYLFVSKSHAKELDVLYGSTNYTNIGSYVDYDSYSDEDEEEEEEEEDGRPVQFAKAYILASPEKTLTLEDDISRLEKSNMPLEMTVDIPQLILDDIPFLPPPIDFDMNLNIPIQDEVRRDEEVPGNVEKARKRSNKSSFGYSARSEFDSLHDPTRTLQYLDRTEETGRLSKSYVDDETFMFGSSGPLMDNRYQVKAKLAEEAKEKYPEPLNLDEYAAGRNRKEAARIFDSLLGGLKDGLFRVDQIEPYAPIYITHIVTESVQNENE